jgi:hypothetical protein
MFGLRSLSCCVGPLFLAVAAGCGSSPMNPGHAAVTGKITLDGQPLAGASVTFVGVGDTPGAGATGTTDETGTYVLAHFRAGAGLPPGDYKVMIAKRVMSDGSPIPAGTLSIAELATRELIPPRYSDYQGTQLTAVVHKDSTSPLDFHLASR